MYELKFVSSVFDTSDDSESVMEMAFESESTTDELPVTPTKRLYLSCLLVFAS